MSLGKRVGMAGLMAIVLTAGLLPILQPSRAAAHGAAYERVCTLPSGTTLYYLNNHQANHLQQVVAGVDGTRAVSKLGSWFGRGFRLPWFFGATNLTSYNVWKANQASGWQGVKIAERKWGPFTIALLVVPKYQGSDC